LVAISWARKVADGRVNEGRGVFASCQMIRSCVGSEQALIRTFAAVIRAGFGRAKRVRAPEPILVTIAASCPGLGHLAHRRDNVASGVPVPWLCGCDRPRAIRAATVSE
jgi:hypothetical protein